MYLVICSRLLIVLTSSMSILWSDQHCNSRYEPLQKPDFFLEQENRLVVGTKLIFKKPRANQMARYLAQWEDNACICQNISALFRQSTGQDSRPSQTTRRPRIMLPSLLIK